MDAEEYRRRAKRCLTLARMELSPTLRAGYIDMAARWKLFAQRAERPTPVAQQQTQNQAKKKTGLISPKHLLPKLRYPGESGPVAPHPPHRVCGPMASAPGPPWRGGFAFCAARCLSAA